MMNPVKLPIHAFRIWIRAVRPFSFTASMVPVFFAAAWAVYLERAVWWILLPPVVLASLCVHAATNLVNEYFDYVKGVDRPDTLGGSRVLVEGLLRPETVLAGGAVLFAATGVIGLVFAVLRGWPILVIGAVGMAGGIFYSSVPIGFKYRGLGDLTVFWMMGPLMSIGAFYVLTGEYVHSVLVTSLPIGCLVAGILSGNNLRDIEHDGQAGIRTTAGVLGERWAKLEYCGLVAAAYLVIAALVILRQMPVWSLLVFLSFPMAVKNIRLAAARSEGGSGRIASLDVQTARLHLLFGVLMIVSVLLRAFFK